MTHPDIEAEVERMLPCSGGLDCQYGGRNFHKTGCQAHRRPAVAQALQAERDRQSARIAELEAAQGGEFLAAAGKLLRWGPNSANPLLPPDQQETNLAWMRREMRRIDCGA